MIRSVAIKLYVSRSEVRAKEVILLPQDNKAKKTLRWGRNPSLGYFWQKRPNLVWLRFWFLG
jgi:hypothetical protein